MINLGHRDNSTVVAAAAMAADPDHDFVVPDQDFFGLGPAEFAGEGFGLRHDDGHRWGR